MDDINWQPHAANLAKDLTDIGAIRDPDWAVTFAATPRHVFVPRFYQMDEFNQPRTLVDSADSVEQDRPLETIYSDQVLVTHYQVLDGKMPDGQEIRTATSSASMPSIVATMLDRLTVQVGQRVLEIGTGTGYNAALLANRLGDEHVTSIEVEPETAAEAAEHLHTAGLRPALVVGDGAAGHPARAPYDRIIATCAADRIPSAWIDQLADGGIIVAPLAVGGMLVVLHKTSLGTVSGRVDAQPVGFMPLRPAGQHMPDGWVADIPNTRLEHHTTTCVEPQAWADPNFQLWLGLHRPGMQTSLWLDDAGGYYASGVYTATGRATVDYTAGASGDWPVTQDSERVWDTVEAAWVTWQQHGRPDRTRIGITAQVDGDQYAWIDDQDGPMRWPLPTPKPCYGT
ncbi:methyltransferase domain-containing protein [Natronosporangium hydrolyticum]|uniref:Protein-L-isoaspartate O-methyltransferase n=1 Tax=Natronosporangium hydrolyticum TaxID=2811111 RepID=A0A895YC10_9ACTN|nr:methyltransferase domain-containing protein [Natronosporangium hydrolyticum]QSB12859.1 methyltransferase domain-containing protein [Natronosporangium hydrolyticum]